MNFPSEGITPVACIATMLGYKCLKYETLREDTILGIFEGHSQAGFYIRSMKELVERGTAEAKWCPEKWCNAYGSQEGCVQPIETIRSSLPYVQTKPVPTVLGNSEFLSPRSCL